MPENNGAPEAAERIRVGDMSGTMVVGSHNTVNHLRITAEYGSTVTVHGGPLPDPVRRRLICQLPRPAAESLIGREQDVQALRRAIDTRQLVQVWGASGVGKSALLRHLACTMPQGPEGAAYIGAGGRTTDDIAQAIFDISFDAPNYKPSLEVLKEHLKTLRLRIYLDDAGLDEKDLHRLFDMAEQSTFVFTSQQRSAVGGVHAIRLEGLTASAGAKLVETVLARGLRRDEARTVEALCDAVDGNPLRLRRIASSATAGRGLPGVADLPELLPALLRTLRPQERDLLHLLGSLSGAELAARHLNDLLGRQDTDALADGLVRHGLLLASETGYSCPPDVAECVLKSRATEFPADRLCQALTTWVEGRDTTPDDVAAHSQALDVAVLRAEKNGQAELGVALARAASPKLALSRQFDAWGSLLGAGWAVARSVGDTEGEEFFLREARTRRQAIGRAAQTTALVLEAGALWRELTALRAHSAAHQVVNTATTTTLPTQPVPPTHAVGNPPAFAHPGAHASVPPASGHVPVAKPVVDFSHLTGQPQAAAHVTGTGSTAQMPKRIDLSQAHTPVAQPAHAAAATPTTTPTATTTATSTGHTALTAAGAAGTTGGMSGLAIACAIGFLAVLGVGATVYANEQPKQSSAAPSGLLGTPSLFSTPSPLNTPSVDISSTVDPVCATVIQALPPEIAQFNTDVSTVSDAIDSYNSAMGSYNAGETSTAPDDSTVIADVDTVISDLNNVESTLQGAISQAQDSAVATDLNGMLTATQQLVSLYQSYENNAGGAEADPSSQAMAMNSASDSLDTDCGD